VPNGGQVTAVITRERSAFLVQVCRGLRLACNSSVAGDEQRRRDHDQQQVLDHVIREEHVVVAADAALRRDHHHGQAAEEQPGPPQRPRTGRMAAPHPQHAPQVQARRHHDEARDHRGELPPGDDLKQAEGWQLLASHAAETTSPPSGPANLPVAPYHRGRCRQKAVARAQGTGGVELDLV
jgi:hypothetical protein